jgi:hypothetical protein
VKANYSFYDPATGIFSGVSIGCTPERLPYLLPAGAAAWEGKVDPLSQRVQDGNLVDYVPPKPSDSELETWSWDAASKRWLAVATLAQVKSEQCAVIDAAYFDAIQASIAFTTAGGVSQTFQADTEESQAVLLKSVVGYGMAGATPAGFFWKALDNTQVPFTFGDLQGLYAAMLSRGQVAFDHRTTLKAAINAATTEAQVIGEVW